MNLTKLLPSVLLLCAMPATAQQTVSRLNDELPRQWEKTPQTLESLPEDNSWWHSFNDPILDSLINKAVANNYNVAAAVKRIEMARRSIQETQAGYFPTLSLNGGWDKAQQSGAIESPKVPSTRSSYFSLGATMNWEIDIFGRVKAAANAKKAAYNATKAEYDGVMASLCAQVATAYIQLRTYQTQLDVAEKHIASQKKVESMVMARYEAELADMLEVTQSRTVLYNTETSVPGLRASIRTLINSISTLIGEYPGETTAALSQPGNLPQYDHTIEAGIPSDILRRRPDIVEAEMTLSEYAANVGIAKKDFLPALSLNGTIGTSAHKAGDLFGSHSLSYSISPQLSWTLFDGLARNYRTAEAKLQLEAAVDSYNLTVMNAVEEVDNALIKYDSALQSIDLQKKVVEESEKSLQFAVDLYKAGLTDFSNVVDGQLNWLESQNTLVELEGKALASVVTIYKALGY